MTFLKNNWFRLSILGLLVALLYPTYHYFFYYLPELEERKIEQQLTAQNQMRELDQREIFRQECVEMKEEARATFEDFLNSCTRSNSIEYCENTDAYKMFAKTIGPEFLNMCITNKENLVY